MNSTKQSPRDGLVSEILEAAKDNPGAFAYPNWRVAEALRTTPSNAAEPDSFDWFDDKKPPFHPPAPQDDAQADVRGLLQEARLYVFNETLNTPKAWSRRSHDLLARIDATLETPNG